MLTPSGIAPSVITSLVADGMKVEMPKTALLYQNYPNPFNPATNIQFDLPNDAVVTLKIYNILGQEVATLIDHGAMFAGNQEAEFSAGNLASGVYFYRLVAEPVADEDGNISGGQFVSVKKMVLVK